MNDFTMDDVPLIAWVVAGVVLVLVIGAIDSYFGGWLLLVLVVSMVFAAKQRSLL